MVAPEQRKLIATDWDLSIARPRKSCERCEGAFGDGIEYVSVLRIDQSGMARAELCPPCFEAAPGEWFAFWRTKAARIEDGRRRPLDMNFLVEFFKRMQNTELDERMQQVGYIVTLILIRKKMLALAGTETNEAGECLVVRFAREADSDDYRVPVPALTEERIADIKEELTRVFNIDEFAVPKSDATTA